MYVDILYEDLKFLKFEHLKSFKEKLVSPFMCWHVKRF